MSIELLNMDCMEYMATQPDNAFDLIIVDPPYFEVKGEFDFVWSSFDDYLKDVELWAKELARILKDNGSLFWWGHAKKIAYSQIILDKYLNLENNMIWEKKDSMQFQYYSPDLARSFNTHNERVLYYSKEIERTGLEEINNDLKLYKPIRDYFKEERKKTDLSYKEINEKCFKCASNGGGLASGILTSYKIGWIFPTKERYESLQKIGICPKPYEDLRKEYEDLRRPFNNGLKLTDVLTFSQESQVTRKHKHPTQKAPTLTRALVSITAKKGGKAFIPFMGSGTEAIECYNFGMKVTATETNEDYFKAAKERFDRETRQIAMF